MTTSTNKIAIRSFFFSIFITAFIVAKAEKNEKILLDIKLENEEEKSFKEKIYIDSPDIDLPFPIDNGGNNPYGNQGGSGVDFKDPLNFNREIVYDPVTGEYVFRNKIGDNINSQPPYYMDKDEYRKYDMDRALENYWKSQIEQDNAANGEGDAPELDVETKDLGDIFGSKLISIVPQGSAELKFGVNTSKTDNPAIPVRQRSLTTFDFDQQIQLNVTGSIGDKLKINTSYNTEATFDFENQMKLGFEGKEDDIIQKVEAGHITYPVSNSLIQGSQSLFGLRTDLKFGKLNISTVLSQQKGERKEINIKGGAQIQEYELTIDNYEANRHYFLNHYHRDNFDNAMSTLPNVSSQVRVTRVEVWVTNRINDFEDTRNIIAFADLGEQNVLEGNPGASPGTVVPNLPYNNANGLYQYITDPSNAAIRDLTAASTVLGGVTASPGPFVQAQHYEKLENARLLSSQEYKFNSVLGYISLNQSLNNDEVLAVAYQYTYQGKTYQVGEFSTDGVEGKKALFLKLLRGTNNTPAYKRWDLMMKNIYSIGAYQISPKNFKLDVWYNNPKTGVDINYIPQPGVDNKLVLQLIGSDILNAQNASYSDGVFDFVPFTFEGNKIQNGGTINPQNGQIVFSRVEPFGATLEQVLINNGVSPAVAKTIAYPQLYDSTKIKALQVPELNRFKLKGTYESSSSSEISLNAFNIPQGSVVVTAGGVRLIENQDYTVDYNLGRVKIINDGVLNSGTPIKIALESNSLFSTIQKSLIGTHFDYRISKNFNLGATMLRLSERPLTQKVNIGDEPIKNTMLGINGNFQSDAPFLTKLVDAIPLLETKEKSSISANIEAAYLIPGHSKAIGKDGNSYIDDFEGSQSAIDIRSFNTWVLASIPQGQNDLFPEASFNNDVTSGENRALINWNVIDPTVFHQKTGNLAPSYVYQDAIYFNNLTRQVRETEVFPNRSINANAGDIDRVAVFNLAYFPEERGPYNFDTSPDAISAGLNNNGLLNNPSSRWGGIMRQLQTNDFENANIEYIQFWVMDPFNSTSGNGSNDDSPNSTGGDLYFNLGNVSEDILKDGSKSFENGLTSDGSFDPNTMKTTAWGRVPTTQAIVNAFDNDVNTRQFQDVGLDGLSNTDESNFFSSFVSWVNGSSLTSTAKAQILADPSGDDYTFYRDDNYDAAQADVLNRYKKFNGLEGNSPTNEQSQQENAEGYPTSKTTLPDIEDINRDNNLSETESYYQYKVSLRPSDMVVGKNFIVDKVSRVHTESGKSVDWYQFKIPVRQPTKVINGIQDFRSIRFLRVFMKQFNQPVVLRFARLELIRGTWRRFEKDIIEPGEYIQNDPSGTTFNIGAVNIEENSNRQPIKYVTPPGIIREQNPNAVAQNTYLNEQALELEVCGLKDGVGKAAFRNVEFDVLSYNKIKMFVHAEKHSQTTDVVNDDDVTVFVRLGSDFEYNYYEYEMPLKLTPYGASDAEDIWPEENNIEIVLQDLKNLKIARNNSLSSGAASLLSLFTQALPSNDKHLIKVIGNPNLRGLKTIMVGIRNPHKDQKNPWKPDDGLEKCVKVWINELRLTDFDNQGGYAAQSRVQANLADFASVALAGHISTPGFGNIEQKVSDRQRETIKQVDASTNVQLGKFFGNKSGVQIPMYLGFSEGIIDPQFDPLNPDIEFKESVADLSPDEQLARRKASRDLTVRRSLNFSNVRINKPNKNGKSYPWDIKNFSASYSYNELYKRDIQTDYNTNKLYNGQLNYTFQTNAKPWTPFRNAKALRKSKWLQLVRDFNVSPIPKQFAFRTNIDRTYNESKARDITGNALIIPQFSKTFTWDRNYDLKWDLTKSLKIDYNANNNGFIGEPQDLKVNKQFYPDEYQAVKDSVLKSLSQFGENNHYAQTTNVTYAWPLRKIPLLDFINLNTKYSVSYDWQRAPLSQDSLGHTIQNSRNVSWNGNFNMINLYNKVPYLRKVNQKGRSRGRNNKKPTYEKKGDKKTDKEKEEEKEAEKKAKKEDPNRLTIVDGFAKVLMSLKTVTFNYAVNDGTLLPGYSQNTELFGLSSGFAAPGVPFVFGGEQERDLFGRQTNNDFAMRMAARGWLVGSSNRYITQQHTTNHSKKFNGRASLEPFNGVRLELTADYNFSENMTENFIWDSTNTYNHLNTMRTGNYSTSFNSIKTAFMKDDNEGNSALFTQLLNNRRDASKILSEKNPNSSTLESTGYYDGYGATQQDVVISSFLAAYSGKGLNSNKLNPFSLLPALNWRLTIDGLSRIEAMKKIFKSITFAHAYNSTFSIASFTTNLEAAQDPLGNQTSRDQANNIIPQQQILTVAITEQFSPLFKVDATWQNSLITKFEYKTNRNISLSLTNNQITELKGSEIVIGTGYRFEKVELPFKLGNKKPVSDINARIDVSIRSNKTIIRKIVEEQNQLTSGQQYISIKGSADYVINSQFTLRFYYDRVMTNPYVSTSFPTMNQNVGFALRINLFQ